MKTPTVEEILDMVLETLNLEVEAEFTPATPLFGDTATGALGLDSIDALEIGAVVKQRYGVQMKAQDEASRNAMYCVKNLHVFISENIGKETAGKPQHAVATA
ncbi:MAG TPA: phosphopantetheine-binding protein [Dongiaceae bacterium]|nr:phosphopantetheine-binding protein [Dongiaceae bacterium]